MLQRPSLVLPEEDDEEEGGGPVSTWDPPPETWQAEHPRGGACWDRPPWVNLASWQVDVDYAGPSMCFFLIPFTQISYKACMHATIRTHTNAAMCYFTPVPSLSDRFEGSRVVATQYHNQKRSGTAGPSQGPRGYCYRGSAAPAGAH